MVQILHVAHEAPAMIPGLPRLELATILLARTTFRWLPCLTWPTNITVKCITGRVFTAYRRDSTPAMLWPEAPRIAALDCNSILEMANATVKVTVTNGAV